MGRLANSVAIVTGAGRGIGQAIALRLAEEGADVVAIDLDEKTATVTTQAIEDTGRQALALALDVSDVTQIMAAVAQIISTWQRIDTLVNCAGTITISPLLAVTEAEWDRVLQVNLKGTFFMCQTVGQHMVQQGSGSIISMASVAGRGGRADAPAYAASKAGVISVTRSAALAFAAAGVRVNAVCPGVIDTPMVRGIDKARAKREGLAQGEALQRLADAIPLGHIGHPDNVADVVAFLASDEAKYVTGQAINVCGGIEMD